jgi:outer membrane receptor for ferrienterochelin and colicin
MVASIDKINLNSVYSFTEAQSNYKEATDGISSHSINFKLRYNPFKTLDILFSSRFNSSKTVDTSLPDENDNRNELILPAYSTSDLSITKSFKDKNYLKVGVKNIFNYIDTNEPPAMPDFLASYEAGRRFFISINFQLSRKL